MADTAVSGAVILAAGASRRWGGPKLLERIGGSTLIGRTVRVVLEAGFRPAVVVTGAWRERIAAEAAGAGAETVFNPAWERGMGTSLAAGIAHLLERRPAPAGAVVVPADLPALDPATLRELPVAAARAGLPMAAVTWEGAPLQAPAWFARSLLPELLGLDGDQGARHLLRAHPERVAALHLPAPLHDLDHPPGPGSP